MRGVVVATLIAYLGPSAVAQDRVGPTIAEQVLTEASCRAWMVLHENNWGHQGREKADVEQWTVQYVRKYAKAARERMERDDPTKDWGAEEGADVSDFQIVKWISGYCAKNPDDPIIKAAFFLTFMFGNSADHTQLPPAP